MPPFLKRKRGAQITSATSVPSEDASSSHRSVARRPSTSIVPPSSVEESSRSESGNSTMLLDVAKLVLSLTESAAEAIPVAGSPIKAAIGGILKVLELFDVRGKNKKQASRLVRKLKDLDKRMEWAKSNGKFGDMSSHLEELIRQLNDVQDALMKLHTKTNSIIGSSSVMDELLDLENEIEEFLSSYNLSATMNIESTVNALNSFLTQSNGGADALRRLSQSHVESSALHSCVEAGVDFIDPRGRKTRVPLAFVSSFEHFKKYLDLYFDVDSKFAIRGATYVKTGHYRLTCGKAHLSEDNWDLISKNHGPLEMYLLMKEKDNARPDICPRCGNQVSFEDPEYPGTISCWRCDLDFRGEELRPFVIYFPPELWQAQSDFDFFCKFMSVLSYSVGYPSKVDLIPIIHHLVRRT
ncbi:hypothetical protein SCHPADRAFT_622555 [Schizopora paradoxa]|uniref:Ubiquitin-like domain-containing protein n=1 Tax=Schizopora paradoxa TaxID=27342 RepID=A0A0H2R8C7_9AGAM|nr:hypothetical protein SCHPADRAFT_622555 [Schizopora paradoxa]